MVVRPPQTGVFEACRERLTDGSFGPGDASALGVEQLPAADEALRSRPFAFDQDVGPAEVFVERVAHAYVREVRPAAELQSRVVPDAQRNQARVPVPAVAHGGFHDVGGLRAVGRFGVALRHGIYDHFEPVVRREKRREVGLHGGEHSFALGERQTVEAHLVAVVDTLRHEPEPLVVGQCGAFEFGAVGEVAILQPREHPIVVGPVPVGVAFGAGDVGLHGAGHRRRNEATGCGRAVGGVAHDPGEGLQRVVADHRERGYSLHSRYSAL